MFSKMGEYEPCGIFTTGHFILIGITIVWIIIALKYSYKQSKEKIHKIIICLTIFAWILEISKIAYTLHYNSIYAVSTYVPLYYCSMLLYAGLLSSFGKGHLKRIGDVSLATGSIVGGLIFLIYPATSLPKYPAFHILSLHSFLYHGIMVYLGLLINTSKYIELQKSDFKYFAGLVGSMSILALIVNKLFKRKFNVYIRKFSRNCSS